MDPVTISVAMGVANSAFNAIKSGFAAARDIEQMSGDIGRWMGAVSDIDNELSLKLKSGLSNSDTAPRNSTKLYILNS